ncbi:MAG: hypothetical protein ACYTKD_20965 [Planctomycetota bacterium]
MFGLIKSFIVLAILLGAVIAGLAYLPDETTKEMGSQAAGVFTKGCRGGRMLLDSFKEKMKEEAVETAKEEVKDAVSPSADPAPGE